MENGNFFIKWTLPNNKLCMYDNLNILNDNVIKFNKINNILYSNDYHINYDVTFLNYNGQDISHLLEKDFKRFSNNKNILDNPRFLFVSLCYDSSNNAIFDTFDNSKKYKWAINDFNIMNMDNGLLLNAHNDKLLLSNTNCKWEITKESFIKNTENNVYLSCDVNYNIILTKDISDAIQFIFQDNSIHYMKPSINVDFETNNSINSVSINDLYEYKYNNDMNIGILLAAGTSSRFITKNNDPKQLYCINNIPIIMYSIDAMIECLDELLIITNDRCYQQVKNLTEKYNKVTILINNVNCRLESVQVGLQYIKTKYDNIKNIIVHDSARPFITEDHITTLLNECNTNSYSQYCIKLVNGLAKQEYDNIEMVDRDKYIEMCTPLCANFYIFYFIFMNYIHKSNRIVYEHLPILNILKIKYTLIPGNYLYLKKITYYDDII